MGALDAEAKQYLGKKETFADAFNYLLYDGEQVIKPDQLQEMDTSQIALPYGNEARLPVQKYRDLLKIWEAMTDGKMIYVILGAELQGKIHYAMPVKDGLYDMIGYSNQVEEARRSFKKKRGDVEDGEADLYAEDGVLKIKLTSEEFLSGFRKTDKLIPIVSAVIYVGSESWDGPKSLMEMMDIQDKRILPFLNDYKLNIISAADMPEDAFDRFHTDLGITMKIIKHQKYDADKIIEGTNHRKIDPDAAFFLKKAANLDLEFEIEEGGVDMCESLKKKEQRDKITGAIEYMKYDGKSDEDIIAWIIKKYQVTRDYVLALLAPKAV
jgi:hypothetical protein